MCFGNHVKAFFTVFEGAYIFCLNSVLDEILDKLGEGTFAKCLKCFDRYEVLNLIISWHNLYIKTYSETFLCHYPFGGRTSLTAHLSICITLQSTCHAKVGSWLIVKDIIPLGIISSLGITGIVNFWKDFIMLHSTLRSLNMTFRVLMFSEHSCLEIWSSGCPYGWEECSPKLWASNRLRRVVFTLAVSKMVGWGYNFKCCYTIFFIVRPGKLLLWKL